VTRFSFGAFGTLARAAIVVATALVAGCGSGAVSAPPVPPEIGPISITPSTATLYSDAPTTFIVTGGNGNYIIVSDNQAVLPVAGAFTGGNILTLVPNPVASDTTVTLTVRDTISTTPVTAVLTVKPRTVNNVITVTPSTAECAAAVCSGGDAEVKVSLSQAGLPLANRTVRIDVVSGNFRVITSPAGSQETTALTGTVVTDASGVARVRIRVLADSPSQTGLLQITDVGSGSSQRASFLIAQNTGASAGFFVTPTAITFQGSRQNQCSSGASADVFVFGGVPPYTVLNTFPTFVSVSNTFVASSGGKFTVTTLGPCLSSGPIVVRDSAGRTATLTVTNSEGSQASPDLKVAPDNVTLNDCSGVASASIVGGTGSYTATSGNSAVFPIVSGNTISVQRVPGTKFIGEALIGISDGQSTATLTVHVTGPVATEGACPS
jgi:hypothetical protein